MLRRFCGTSVLPVCCPCATVLNYRPQSAVWLSSNHEVNADADDDALWGRVKVIHFPHSRLGNEDKNLKLQLQSQDNLEAVLAWAIEGAYQWYQRGGKGLETPQAVKELTSKQRSDQESVGLWLVAGHDIFVRDGYSWAEWTCEP